ncbi:MAG TPA: type II toxin-antitoxin system RelE/ParE family toxin [Candidatus Kapabacteria bacterium]|nr:type II toxin-antitoxin system RelE/ParE family toxin [Candidatus Kapabacteria bacterium]
MESIPRIVEAYRSNTGKWYFDEWFDSLMFETQAQIAKRLNRMKVGLFGDTKPVGEGVTELRIHVGPGYRVYYGQDDKLVLLLAGSDKSEQKRTIKLAIDLWREYKATKR